jgi:D-alanyl-D-alanine dipeptidase
VIGAAFLLAAAGAPAPDFVDVTTIAPSVVVDMKYAGDDNFVGERIRGYRRNKCLLTRSAAEAVAAAQAELSAMGRSLRIYDCYRPQRAVDHFVRWSKEPDDAEAKARFYPNIDKAALFEKGYIADKSGHSRGSTLDLTIDGLDMGSPFDLFDPRSNTDDPTIGAEPRANRLLLKRVLEKSGFRNYPLEWWHYTLDAEPYPDAYFDCPVK